MPIQVDDIKIEYIPIREAKQMSGLRIVLGAFAIPGPWHEACRGIYYVKGLDYAPVQSSNDNASDVQIGMENSQSELVAWTAQSSAPVVIWHDERPRSLWNDQLHLAERLSPEPPLIPTDLEDRIRMFGLANELLGAFPGAFSSCAAIAATTREIKIGTGVINPFTRHPVLIAMELAALDQLSGGRAILGLGASIKLWVEEQMGIRYDKPVSALRDAVAIIRGLFAGEPVEYQGRVFSAGAGMRFNLEPLRADVPIYLGATAPKALELAGEVADGWLPFGFGPEAVGRAIEHVRIGGERAGRNLADFAFSSLIFTSVADEDQAARDAIKPTLATMLGWFANQPDLPLFTDHGLTPRDVSLIRESYTRGEVRTDMVSEAMVDGLTMAGSPRRCREKLARLIEAGITTAVFLVAPSPDFAKDMEWLHRNVIRDFV